MTTLTLTILCAAAQDVQVEETAKQKQASVELCQLLVGVLLFKEFALRSPKTLKELVEKPADVEFWPDGGFLAGGKLPKDPWGNEYQYEEQKQRPVLWSWGSDGKRGGTEEAADIDLGAVFRRREPPPGPERNQAQAVAFLKTLALAQADFRSNDRDGNLRNDFWVGDMSGLFRFCASVDGKKPHPKPSQEQCIKLIEQSLADADAAPLDAAGLIPKAEKPKPASGYFFRVIELDIEGKAYAEKSDDVMVQGRSYATFAFCAYPAEHGKTGTMTFIMDESMTIWSKDTKGQAVKQFPAEPKKDGWTRAE